MGTTPVARPTVLVPSATAGQQAEGVVVAGLGDPQPVVADGLGALADLDEAPHGQGEVQGQGQSGTADSRHAGDPARAG
jgi:hypothetical protein